MFSTPGRATTTTTKTTKTPTTDADAKYEYQMREERCKGPDMQNVFLLTCGCYTVQCMHSGLSSSSSHSLLCKTSFRHKIDHRATLGRVTKERRREVVEWEEEFELPPGETMGKILLINQNICVYLFPSSWDGSSCLHPHRPKVWCHNTEGTGTGCNLWVCSYGFHTRSQGFVEGVDYGRFVFFRSNLAYAMQK